MKPFLALLIASCLVSETRAERVEHQGIIYQTFVTSPERISLFWRDPSGKQFRQFSVLQRFLEQGGKRIEFVMNGGIFERDGVPSGLLVIDHQIIHPLNSAKGVGNFFLQPNGVFFVQERSAFIRSTEEFAKRSAIPRLAIQSGPLLLRNGQTHPAFRKESSNYLHRNGVGVRKDGSVIFAITELGQPRFPNLFEFADFFRSQGCSDALFLDGDISQSVEKPDGAIPPGNHFGSIFAVVE